MAALSLSNNLSFILPVQYDVNVGFISKFVADLILSNLWNSLFRITMNKTKRKDRTQHN